MVATDPTGWTSHTDDFHRGMTWKLAVRAATTASITIATALNNGDVLDGVTLATGDRILVKDQATGSQNGIYIVSASPARAPDMDQDSTTAVPSQEVLGAVVIVFSGTVNAGTMWRNTNTTAPTLGTTALTFAQIGGVSAGAVTTSGLTMATARLLGRTTAATGAIEEITVGSGLSLSAGSLTATGGGSGTVTTVEEVDGTPTDSAVTKIVFPNGTLSIASHVATYTAAAGSSTWPPLDQYSIDGTYGDNFAAGSLNGRWTRRNYTSGAETYQFTKNSTGLRIAVAGRANGDGYLQTAPGGDWTFAMKYAPHQFGANTSNWGIVVMDTNGTGLVTQLYNSTPSALLLVQLTTYTTYGGAYVQPGSASSSPNLNLVNSTLNIPERPIWVWLRKSGTSYYINISLDGEAWWVEGGPITWAGTVDRIGMLHGPLANATGSTGATNDAYWFNKIA